MSPPPDEHERQIRSLLDRLTHLRRYLKGQVTGAADPGGFSENGLPSDVEYLGSLLNSTLSCLDTLRRIEAAERLQRSRVRLLSACAMSVNGLRGFGAGRDAWQAATEAVRHSMIACVDVADAELREARLDLMRIREHLNNLAMKKHKRTR